jgi:phosphoglycolate phosphatase
MNRKLVVFDFDGTLVDFMDSFESAVVEFSMARSIPYDVKKLTLGYVDPKKNDLGWGVPFDDQEDLLEELSNFMKMETTERQRFIPPLFSKMGEALDELAEQHELGIVTARNRESLNVVLNHHKILHHFPNMRTLNCARERGYPIKPAPDALYCLLKDTKHTLDDVIMVGDTTADIDMANAAGVKSIAVAWGLHPRERLLQSKPSMMAETIGDLPRIIKELFN